MNNKKTIATLSVFTLLLVLLDQIIKLIINAYYSNAAVELIPHFLAFKPVHNTDLSWFGSLGIGLFANYTCSIVFNLVILAVSITLYHYITVARNTGGFLVNLSFLLLLSGIVCSTIDRLFWKGSLDYIRLEGFFTFDLKDCYISAFTGLFLYGCIRHHKSQAWQAFTIGGYVESLRKFLRE